MSHSGPYCILKPDLSTIFIYSHFVLAFRLCSVILYVDDNTNLLKDKSMKTIKVIQQGKRWMAYFSDDGLLLPTPFSPLSRTIEDVKAKLQTLNPDYTVID
jgi:hypothetical protein